MGKITKTTTSSNTKQGSISISPTDYDKWREIAIGIAKKHDPAFTSGWVTGSLAFQNTMEFRVAGETYIPATSNQGLVYVSATPGGYVSIHFNQKSNGRPWSLNIAKVGGTTPAGGYPAAIGTLTWRLETSGAASGALTGTATLSEWWKYTSGIHEITKPIPHGGKKIMKITRDSDGKVLTFLLPWVHRVTFSSSIDTVVDGQHFYKYGYIFNQNGTGNFYNQNFDSSPLGLRYVRHHNHAIGYEQAIFPVSFMSGSKKVRMRFVAGSTSGYGDTVQATSIDRGLAEGELEFWTDSGGQEKFKLNYNKPYVAHNGVTQRSYPLAIKDLAVGVSYNLTSSWTRISVFNFNAANGYWAMIYVRKNGGNIEIAQQCDWHGAAIEFGVFAILGYDTQ